MTRLKSLWHGIEENFYFLMPCLLFLVALALYAPWLLRLWLVWTIFYRAVRWLLRKFLCSDRYVYEDDEICVDREWPRVRAQNGFRRLWYRFNEPEPVTTRNFVARSAAGFPVYDWEGRVRCFKNGRITDERCD